MQLNFSVEHIAGAKNFGQDALSRFPSLWRPVGTFEAVDVSWGADFEEGVVANASGKVVSVISWDKVRKERISDLVLSILLHHLATVDGVWPAELREFEIYRSDLSNVDGVILFKGWVLVPDRLLVILVHVVPKKLEKSLSHYVLKSLGT